MQDATDRIGAEIVLGRNVFIGQANHCEASKHATIAGKAKPQPSQALVHQLDRQSSCNRIGDMAKEDITVATKRNVATKGAVQVAVLLRQDGDAEILPKKG